MIYIASIVQYYCNEYLVLKLYSFNLFSDSSVNPRFEVSVRLETKEERAIVQNIITSKQSLKGKLTPLLYSTVDVHVILIRNIYRDR